ncbi:MAG: hypothetical protein JWQ06_2550, partial [Mucilaginibacter sp.]|nr:hypothetical protein [Mucilaginibacter sp.]
MVPLYEYYNPDGIDHRCTTNGSGWPGYNPLGIIGYLSTVNQDISTQVLNEYYGNNTGHFYSSPPETIDPNVFTFNTLVGFVIPASHAFATTPTLQP